MKKFTCVHDLGDLKSALAEAFEIHGSAVDEDALAVDPHFPDSDLKRVGIENAAMLRERDAEGIEIGIPDLPEMRFLKSYRSLFPICLGGFTPFFIQELEMDGTASRSFYAVSYLCSFPAD